jgi:hypothetical protein
MQGLAANAQMFERALNSRGVKLRAIHEVLMGASSDELNYIFQTINCAALVEVAWDETMVMLTRPGPRERLAELSVYSRRANSFSPRELALSSCMLAI